MTDPSSRTWTAFRDETRIAGGQPIDVAMAVKAAMDAEPDAGFLTFDDATGRVVDLDLRGGPKEIAARLTAPAQAAPVRGRPKLGVVAREVTLLPRHWDWLARQRGGASQALRRLVDDARREDAGRSSARAAQAAAYAFLSTMAGDRARFAAEAGGWPADVRAHAERLLDGAASPAGAEA